MRRILVLAICLLLPLGAGTGESQAVQDKQASEKGVALKADKLLSEPFADAKQVGKVARGDAVTILKKNGGWYQVKASGAEGWIRMLSVRRGEAAKTSAAKDVAALSTGRAGTGQIVSTTGVRGLSEEQLKSARFDENELKKAESFGVSKSDASAFAQKGGLLARAFNYLPAN
jgi:uncharacterized protein YgiM (DUF1202 family)